jgi:hypothetical protein
MILLPSPKSPKYQRFGRISAGKMPPFPLLAAIVWLLCEIRQISEEIA